MKWIGIVHIIMFAMVGSTVKSQEGQYRKVGEGNFITVDSVKLHYRMGGQGPYLLLLHGFTLSSDQWSGYFEGFGKNHTVIAFDFPGHGRSARTGQEFSFKHWTELVLKAIENLGVKKAKAIGHSYGAITLMSIARQQPDLLDAMVLISGAHRIDPAMRQILLEDSFEKSDADLQEYYRQIHNNDMDKINGIFTDIRKFVETRDMFSIDEIEEIQIPVLLVFGDRDTFYPLEIPLEMYKALPNARLWIVPEQGHTPVWASMGADKQTAQIFPKMVSRFFKNSN